MSKCIDKNNIRAVMCKDCTRCESAGYVKGMPRICHACGGPWPQCALGCHLVEDDD